MAKSHARSRKVRLDENWRKAIQTSMIVNRLRDHVLGEVEMTSSQVTAATVLLRKTIPDLSSTELTGDPNKPVNMALSIVGVQPAKK